MIKEVLKSGGIRNNLIPAVLHKKVPTVMVGTFSLLI